MSYFKDIMTTDISKAWQFQMPGVGIQNAIKCIGGEIAAWEYWMNDSDGNYMVKIYNVTTGLAVLVATVYVCIGRDIFCGLFSSGAIPSTDIFDESCIYYRVDYI